jgi:hypothetical protein
MLKKVSFVWLSLVLLVLTASPVMAEATTSTTSVIFPLDQLLVNPCTGETVHITGTLHWLGHITLDDTGRWHTRFQENHQNVVGVGLDSGAEYRIPEAESTVVIWRFLDPQVTTTDVVVVPFIAKGTDENALLQELVHVTVNANGELTVDVDDVRLICQS